MKNHLDDRPIACSLTTVELRDREATLLAQFRSTVIETEELQEGYTFRLPGEGRWLVLIADIDCGRAGMLPVLSV